MRLPQAADSLDPVVTLATAWIRKRDQYEAMIFEWQGFEKLLLKRTRAHDMNLEEAWAQRFPEVAAMQTLDRRMNRTYGALEHLAHRASSTRAVSAVGALAKVGLGLRVQGRYAWQPYALELLERGAGELGAFLAK